MVRNLNKQGVLFAIQLHKTKKHLSNNSIYEYLRGDNDYF